jgi:Domain of unknown function (DUF4388)
MSFTGDLEHLPIVDVIQLLHSTRKTGTLCVKSARGESQLVFNDGYISCANHVNASVRIGQILVDMQAISPEIREQALAGQKEAGAARKPLIATLIEQGLLTRENAYTGLKILIEKTVVEMLRWTRGTFTLDVESTVISDEYRYFPDMLNQDFNLDTQGVLMDALRIFDEKNRNGDFAEDEWEASAAVETAEAASEELTTNELSAEDLGLGDLDQLERKIPEVFSSIKIIDPAEIHRLRLMDLCPGVDGEIREALVAFLARFSVEKTGAEPVAGTGNGGRTLIFYSRDAVIRHVLMTLSKAEGILIFTTDDKQDLDLILAQSLSKGIVPLLLLGSPDETVESWTSPSLIRLRQKKIEEYPQLPVIQLAPSGNHDFALQAYQDGVRAVLPRPPGLDEGGDVTDLVRFFEILLNYLKNYFASQTRELLLDLKNELLQLQGLRDAPELSLSLLQRVAVSFERALTFIVRPGEMIAERGIGIGREKMQGPTPPLKFKVPLDQPSIVHQTLAEGTLFYGRSDDAVVSDYLHAQIGAPQAGPILLLPICSRGRPIALIYGDFGAASVAPVSLESLEILAGQAGLILENALFRRQLEKSV